MDDDEIDLPAPGWDAIDAALTRRYGAQAPQHVAYDPPMGLSDNLQGCSAYRGPAGGSSVHGGDIGADGGDIGADGGDIGADGGDYWHYVSYGLSELYEPNPDADPAVSGWGFELTLRVPAAGDQPPAWPFTMINEIAKNVNRGRMALAAGGRIDLRAPVTGFPHLPEAPDTGLTVYALTLDPELGEMSTPNGRVAFLQLVGVTAAEKDRMVHAGTASVLAELTVGNQLLMTDPARA